MISLLLNLELTEYESDLRVVEKGLDVLLLSNVTSFAHLLLSLLNLFILN